MLANWLPIVAYRAMTASLPRRKRTQSGELYGGPRPSRRRARNPAENPENDFEQLLD
jgi:hypothetical protein